jgi:hypothetical protein
MDITSSPPTNSLPTKKIEISPNSPTNRPPTMQRSDSEASQKSLSSEDLIIQVSQMIKDGAQVELIVLELMEECNFDFHEFKKLLSGMFRGCLLLFRWLPSASLSKSLINPTLSILDQNLKLAFLGQVYGYCSGSIRGSNFLQ